MSQPTPPSSGDVREDQAGWVGAAVAAVWAAASVAALQALGDAVRRAIAAPAAAPVLRVKLRRQVTAIVATTRQQSIEVAGRRGQQAATETAEHLAAEQTAPQRPPRPTGTATVRTPSRVVPAASKPAGLPPAVAATVADVQRQASAQADQASVQMLRSVDDAYRRAVAAVMDPRPGITEAQRLENAQRVLDDLAARGITGFTDRAGRRWELASYVEMATRTAVSRSLTNLQLAAYQGRGVDAVLVVSRTLDAPCPHCRPYDGRVLSISGATVGQRLTVTPWDAAPRTELVVASLAEAMAHGLLHPNCRHSLVPYADGAAMTPPGIEPRPAAEYEAEQRQRALERRVRAAHRHTLLPVAPGEKAAAKRRLAAARQASAAHAAKHGVKRRTRRERATGAR